MRSLLRRHENIKTSSSAVAKRLRDALYLSVVSFIASITQYVEHGFFIISYVNFKFTSTCLWRNVEPWCQTHDSRTTMNVYSSRRVLVRSRAVHSHGQP